MTKTRAEKTAATSIRRCRQADTQRVAKWLRAQKGRTFYDGIVPDSGRFANEFREVCLGELRGTSFARMIVTNSYHPHGLLLGTIIPMFGLRESYATDLLFLTDREGVWGAEKLFCQFLTWGKLRAGNVIVASTSGIRPRGIEKFYEKFGMQHLGPVYGLKGEPCRE